MAEFLFGIPTPIGFTVTCTHRYWEFISSQKHPSLAGRHEEVMRALHDPDEIRRSRKDANVYLFYRGAPNLWICAVVKELEGSAFLITAYLTDAIKAGDVIWTKSK